MITIEQIDEFRKRTNSSYEDAKYYLEKNNGDVLDAIIDFERRKTGRSSYQYGNRSQQNYYNPNNHSHHHAHPNNGEDFGKKLTEIVQKGFDMRVYVEDKNSVLFNIPVILLLLLIPLWFIVIVMFAFFAIIGYKISVKDVKNPNVNVNDFMNNINNKMNQPKNQQENAAQKSSQVPVASNTNVPAGQENPEAQPPKKEGEQKEEGFKEYTIE